MKKEKSSYSKKYTAEELLHEFRAVHGDIYLYPDIPEVHDSSSIIQCVCHIHGEFSVRIAAHIYGAGCLKCSREHTLLTVLENSKNKFLYKVGKLFPLYDFSNYVYTGSNNKSVVHCTKHSIDFLKSPNILLTGVGCPECSKDKFHLTEDEIIRRLNVLYSGFYTYPSLKVKSVEDTISIVCPTHGLFTKSLAVHLMGVGCRECTKINHIQHIRDAVKKQNEKSRDTRFANFIKNALSKHSDRFDYTKVDYVNTYTDVSITCKQHDITFPVKPFTHLQSSTGGCPQCVEQASSYNFVSLYSKSCEGEDARIFYKLLFTHIPTGIRFVKIGITKRTLEERFCEKEYADFSYDVILVHKDTNLNCAVLEAQYKKDHRSSRFFLPKEIKFVGRSKLYEWDEIQQLEYKGISFLRESLLEKQGGVCPICKKVPEKPVLDHSHKKRVRGSSLCRGTICSLCNIFLGFIENHALRSCISYEDLPDILREIANFHENEHTKFIHPTEKPKPKKLKKSSYNLLKRTINGKKKIPLYPKSKKLTKALALLFEEFKIEPEYYE